MYAERILANLKSRGASGRLLTTDAAIKTTGISYQRWQRLTHLRDFPRRVKVSRTWCVDAADLAAFLDRQNSLEAALSLSDAARYLRMTRYTAQRLLDAGKFVAPLGTIHGRPRFARAAVEEWNRERLGGNGVPEEFERKSAGRH